jgi:hypothetical protein
VSNPQLGAQLVGFSPLQQACPSEYISYSIQKKIAARNFVINVGHFVLLKLRKIVIQCCAI